MRPAFHDLRPFPASRLLRSGALASAGRGRVCHYTDSDLSPPRIAVGNFRRLFALTEQRDLPESGGVRAKQDAGEVTWQSRKEGGQRRRSTIMSARASAN